MEDVEIKEHDSTNAFLILATSDYDSLHLDIVMRGENGLVAFMTANEFAPFTARPRHQRSAPRHDPGHFCLTDAVQDPSSCCV